jgi:NAD(P)-dependent dehydrogenase (short-subunit alcohol dehydrogenase family)
MKTQKTVIVTGASQGIGACLVKTFLERGYHAVATAQFGGIDTLVNNAGIFLTKPFTDYTTEDVRKLVSTNLYGFIYLSQLAVRQMQRQKRGGSVVSITTSMVDHPIAGVTASVSMLTKGGIESISKNLAMEYAKEGIRFNTVAPGTVDTPLHQDDAKEFLRTLSPMGSISDAQEIADAVVFLAEATHYRGGAARRWRRALRQMIDDKQAY